MNRRCQFFLAALLILLFRDTAKAKCISYAEARQHIGENRCITGQVIRVQLGSKGTHYLDFCEDYRTCSFTVVIFRGDLKHVGDVRQLAGQTVEVHGDVKLYDERAEIILRDASQLGGKMARIPPLPKGYDVEQKGHYSAGTFSHPEASRSTTSGKKRQPASLPAIVPRDSDSE